MPKMVKVGPNDLYKLPADATPEMKAAWASIQKSRPVDLDYVTAMENIQHSGNMYRLIMDEPGTMDPGPRRLEDYSMEELKVMMLQVGVQTQKQMKRADVIRLIRAKLDEVEIEDDA